MDSDASRTANRTAPRLANRQRRPAHRRSASREENAEPASDDQAPAETEAQARENQEARARTDAVISQGWVPAKTLLLTLLDVGSAGATLSPRMEEFRDAVDTLRAKSDRAEIAGCITFVAQGKKISIGYGLTGADDNPGPALDQVKSMISAEDYSNVMKLISAQAYWLRLYYQTMTQPTQNCYDITGQNAATEKSLAIIRDVVDLRPAVCDARLSNFYVDPTSRTRVGIVVHIE